MKFPKLLTPLIGISLVSLLAASGCNNTQCGAGTVKVGDSCVPAESACGTGTVYDEASRSCVPEVVLVCGTGTMASGGECVPDGSVVCQNNTIFDTASGTCVPDPDAVCSGELVYVESSDSCVHPDRLLPDMADITEPGEPNDLRYNPTFMPPAIVLGDEPTSVYGCVEPMDFDGDGVTDPDADHYIIDVGEPTLIHVRTDGIDGVTASAALIPNGDELAGAGWQRFMLSLSGDGAEGQIFLPAAGTYIVELGDARSLLFGEPAGGPGQCYFTQFSKVALPTPTEVDAGGSVTGSFGDPSFFHLSATDGMLLFPELNILGPDGSFYDNPSIVGGLTELVDSGLNNTGTTSGGVASSFILALADGQDVLLVVDQVYSLTPDTVDFQLDVNDSGAQRMPTDGSALTFTHSDTMRRWAFFSATAGDVVRLQITSPDGHSIDPVIFSPTGEGAGTCDGCDTTDSYVQITETGFHYVGLFVTSSIDEGATYTVSFTQTDVTPTALTRGTSAPVDLSGISRGVFTADLTTADWVELAATSLSGATSVAIEAYPIGEFGTLGQSIFEDFSGLSDGADHLQRIPGGMGDNVLVLVGDAATHDGDESFDFAVNDVPFTDLGTSRAAMPVMRAGETAPAGGARVRYLVRAENALDTVTIELSTAGSLDLSLSLRAVPDGTEASYADGSGPGGSESLSAPAPAPGAPFPFVVSDLSGAGGMFDINVTSIPPPYIEAPADLPLVSICPSQGGSGAVVTMGDDEFSGAVTLGGGFPFFGVTQSELYVSTNGWISFDPGRGPVSGYTATSYGDSDVNVIAPFAGDMVLDEICTERLGGTFVVEMRGTTYPDFFGASYVTEIQAVLHDSGRIDFIYGPSHEADAFYPNFIGLVNSDRSEVLALFGAPTASSAFTLTPR